MRESERKRERGMVWHGVAWCVMAWRVMSLAVREREWEGEGEV